MIVRNWHDGVPAALADRYLALMREAALSPARISSTPDTTTSMPSSSTSRNRMCGITRP